MRRSAEVRTSMWVLLAVATIACSSGDPTIAPAALVTASASTATSTDAERLVLTGVLRATNSELLDTPTTSTWQLSLQWLIQEGAPVEPGDAVARFDPGATQSELHNKQDQIEAKRQERESRIAQDSIRSMEFELALRKTEVDYKKAQIDAAVSADLLAGKDYRERQYKLQVAEQAFRDAQLDALDHEAASVAGVSEIEIELHELQSDVAELNREVESLTLRSSRKGIVLHETHRWFGRPVRVGDRMQATMPVASIPEVDSLEIEAWAGETDAARLEVGMPAVMRLDADPSRPFDGRVGVIGTASERRESWGRGNYRRVAIQLGEVDPASMKPGMSVRCEVRLEQSPGTALVTQRRDSK